MYRVCDVCKFDRINKYGRFCIDFAIHTKGFLSRVYVPGVVGLKHVPYVYIGRVQHKIRKFNTNLEKNWSSVVLGNVGPKCHNRYLNLWTMNSLATAPVIRCLLSKTRLIGRLKIDRRQCSQILRLPPSCFVIILNATQLRKTQHILYQSYYLTPVICLIAYHMCR